MDHLIVSFPDSRPSRPVETFELPGPYDSMLAIRCMFDPWFVSRQNVKVLPKVYAGRLFVASERPSVRLSRRYQIMLAGDDRRVSYVSWPRQYANQRKAKSALRGLLKGLPIENAWLSRNNPEGEANFGNYYPEGEQIFQDEDLDDDSLEGHLNIWDT